MILACSHLVIATENVPRQTRFFEKVFGVNPYFENDMFSEFVLPNKFRVAFFKPVGASSKFFDSGAGRGASAFGVTVKDVEDTFARLEATLRELGIDSAASLSGPPKEHPWGEKSFLVVDPDGNRWEVAQSPTADGMLLNKP